MRDEFGEIRNTLRASDFRLIIVALCLFVVNVSTLAYRLKIIFKGEDLNLPLRKSIQLTYMGYFFNNFMPTAVGGDVIKAHYASHINQERMKSYASVLMDRIIGLYSFLMLAGIALVINWGGFQIPVARNMVFIFLFLGLVGFLIVTSKKVANLMEGFFRRIKMFRLGEKLESLYAIVHDYRNRLDVIAKSILVSMAAQSIYFVIMYLFFLSLGQKVAIGNIFLIMPVVTFISMMPSLGGLGVREGAIVAFFAPIVGKEAAFTASMLLLFGFFAMSFVGGIAFLWWNLAEKRKGVSK
jgi:uncharacterized protein (TIRG00374 family)